MSTRVHELAKELGLKSQDLIDRIQKWGLEVKPSALASLEPATVDRIKELMDGPSPATSAPSDHGKGAGTAEVPASLPIKEPHISPLVAEPRNPGPGTTASTARQHTPTAPTPETPSAIGTPEPAVAVAAPSPPRAVPPAPQQPPHPAALGPRQAPQQPARPAPTQPQRPATGPLSSHTPHRTGPPTMARPGAEPPMQQPAPMPAAPARQPGPMPPAPLQRGDYISPTGTRGGSAPRPNAGQPPLRRPDGGPRPGGRPLPPVASSGGRPLPSVAPPTGPPVRRSDARPGPADGGKVQRPEKRYTPEELRAMMQAGQLNTQPTGPAGGPPRPGAPRPGGPLRPGAPRPGGPVGHQARGPQPPGQQGPDARRPPGMGPLPPSNLAPSAAPAGTDEDEERRKGKAAGGGATDRAGRRAKRNERAQERRVGSGSPVPAATLIEGEDEPGRVRRSGGKKHKGHGHRMAVAPARKSHVEIEPPITLRSLSEAIGVKANELIRKLMNTTGQLITINANIDEEMAQMLALEFGVEIEIVHEHTAEDDLLSSFETPETDNAEDREPRPPVITILGHVDHGKTSLLDKIRRSNVVASESGGITQHIGAYQVEHNGQKIAFVDTPGHEAFTAMRARGANVTDIVVLVVAADDGVMPQTKEAIAHAKAAGVPIVIALNKTDLPGINFNKIYGELSQEGLVPEEYGGDTPVVKTSALTGAGIPDLLEMLGIVAELRDLKGNPKRPATGTCLEASISEGRGVVATVLVQDGTLRVGDAVVCGDAFGRVRALNDDRGRPIQEALPSTPVEISGLDSVPTAGEKFGVVEDITLAREIAETRRARGRQVAERPALTLENLYTKMTEQKVKTLNLILKADVQGSLEALVKELDKLENAEVPLRILHKAVGGIGESDILLADASQAIVIGFRVAPEDRAISLAEEKKIDIRRYDIIYQVTDEIKKAIEGMLVPEIKEVHLGRAIVRQVFKISKIGTVAGCFVTQGTIERSAKVRLIREGREIYKGSIEALKRFKDDVREVREGFECGIKIGNFDDIKNDDTIEAYRIDVIRRTL